MRSRCPAQYALRLSVVKKFAGLLIKFLDGHRMADWANQIRGLLGEFGLIVPQGIGYIATRVPELITMQATSYGCWTISRNWIVRSMNLKYKFDLGIATAISPAS